jgi:guanosine-3',5'-bis(diphosphate) 3'-pyrophosphohydrolase
MSSPIWQRAASFAARAHRHDLRKDGVTPYVAHVFRVAMTARDVFGCDDQVALATALLHDTIEDTGTDYDDILEAFGDEVADGVAALTKNMALRHDIREPEYDQRLAGADWRARLVKLADTYDNFCDKIDKSGTRNIEKMVRLCRRAIRLAQPDAADHDCVRRAIDVVTELIKPYEES